MLTQSFIVSPLYTVGKTQSAPETVARAPGGSAAAADGGGAAPAGAHSPQAPLPVLHCDLPDTSKQSSCTSPR